MKSSRINSISFSKKSIRVVFKVIVGILIVTAIFGVLYWYNNRLFLWEASLLWTQKSFSESKFKAGSTVERAQMAVDLIRNKKLLEIESEKIHALLGPETGDYYYSDSNFTYRLTDRGNADWILTLITGEDGKIKSILIRKSCCSVSQKILYWGFEASAPLVRKLLQ